MKLPVDAGFSGPVGVESPGQGLGKRESAVLGRKLLERVAKDLTSIRAGTSRPAKEVSNA